MGRNRAYKELNVAVTQEPHVLTLLLDTIDQIQSETREKITQGFEKIVQWDGMKNNPPPNFKLSPLAMSPYKSRNYRAILDLSFTLQVDGYKLLLVKILQHSHTHQWKQWTKLG
mmetsp:Transcript_19326/g.42051  ORF Transcript_19326/g.42051 Transcript_19326/m.42051 type:complete len:114 (+) Transcript_19326:436-777(+)